LGYGGAERPVGFRHAPLGSGMVPPPPLVAAASRGDAGALSRLLSGVQDVDVEVGPGGETALGAACRSGSTQCVMLLLLSGASVHAADSAGRTPLHEAAQGNFKPVVRELMKHGPDPDAVDAAGRTPVSIARAAGHRKLPLMLERGRGRVRGKTSAQRGPAPPPGTPASLPLGGLASPGVMSPIGVVRQSVATPFRVLADALDLSARCATPALVADTARDHKSRCAKLGSAPLYALAVALGLALGGVLVLKRVCGEVAASALDAAVTAYLILRSRATQASLATARRIRF